MSKVIKEAMLSKIASLMADVNEGLGKTGSLFIHGDVDLQFSQTILNGDERVLAEVLCSHMDGSEEFKNIMFSIIGSYLRLNPDMKDRFMSIVYSNDVNVN
jgi:hypothetical protein